MKTARGSFASDLVIRFSLLGFVLMIIISVVWFVLFREQLAQNGEARARGFAQQADRETTDYFKVHLATLLGHVQPDQLKDTSVSDWQNFLIQDSSFASVTFVSLDGKPVFSAGNGADSNVRRSYATDPYFKVPMYMGGSIYSDGKVTSAGNEKVVTFSVPVVTSGQKAYLGNVSTSSVGKSRMDGELGGVLIATVKVDPLIEELGALKNEEGGRISLVGRDGGALGQKLSGSSVRSEQVNKLTGWKIVTEIPEEIAFAPMLPVVRFISVVMWVLLIVIVLSGIVFTGVMRARYLRFIKQLENYTKGSRLNVSDDEMGEAAAVTNSVLDRLEGEISHAMLEAASEHKHFEEEAGLLSNEQKRIYEEKMKLETVLSKIKDGVILLNKARNVVVMNKTAEEIVGVNFNEAMGKPVNGVFKCFDKDGEITMDAYAAVSGPNARSVFDKKWVRLESSHIQPKFVDMLSVPMAFSYTQDLAFMIVLHDLHDKLEVEDKKLGLVSLFASELKKSVPLVSSSLQANELPVAQAGLAHLSLVMENLFTLGTIENQSIQLASEPVDLLEITRNLVAVLTPMAGKLQTSITLTDPKVDALGVTGDRQRVYQVVLNLLLNSLFYMQSGGAIAVSFVQSDQDVVLQIQDGGIGIKGELMPKLFEKFYVAENNSGVESGVGVR